MHKKASFQSMQSFYLALSEYVLITPLLYVLLSIFCNVHSIVWAKPTACN